MLFKSNYLKEFNLFKYVLFFSILTISLSILYGIAIDLFGLESINKKGDVRFFGLNFLKDFLSVVIIAPIVETYIFQHLLILFIKKKYGNSFSIFVSGLVFGLFHYYSALYIIHTVLLGFIFAIAYINCENV